MSADVRHVGEDQDPELRVAGKAPAKKPLAEFLAEFEDRLANHPDEAATGALRVVEDRAAGVRRSPAEISPILQSPQERPTPAIEATANAPDETTPAAPRLPPETAAGETSGESRRVRGRRRRKHRHRAH